jgi:hypothetical protein
LAGNNSSLRKHIGIRELDNERINFNNCQISLNFRDEAMGFNIKPPLKCIDFGSTEGEEEVEEVEEEIRFEDLFNNTFEHLFYPGHKAPILHTYKHI